MRYIDADALVKEIERCSYEIWSKGVNPTWWAQAVKVKDNILGCIERQPTVNAVEVRHGRWIKQKQDTEVMQKFHDIGLGQGMSVYSIYWTCSLCGNWGTPNHKYCCSCGAKMDGERRDV